MTVFAETIEAGMPGYAKTYNGSDLVDAAQNAACDIQEFVGFFLGKLAEFRFLVTDEDGEEYVMVAEWRGEYLIAEVA